MKIIKFLPFLIIFQVSCLFAQPKLKIVPDEIEFEDIFQRLETVYFINEGDAPLLIDSMTYNHDYYFIRFDAPWLNPSPIMPDDTLEMDCILSGYYFVPSSDTTDTLYVYSNEEDSIDFLKIKIDYYDDNFNEGVINGKVTDGILPVQNAELSFFYEGNYIIRQTATDENGNYSAALPPGGYLIAARKDSFYVGFYENQFAPLYATPVQLMEDSTVTIDMVLTKIINTGNSISGNIFDDISGQPVPLRGIVVVRNGKHTPSKITAGGLGNSLPNDLYSSFVETDGSFQVNDIIQPDYYFVQSFSDYFVPSYYAEGGSQVFWQNADSIFIDSDITGKDVYMPRDSSTGGGTVSGTITITPTEKILASDLILYAKSVDTGALYNFSFSNNDGTYQTIFLPFGNYQMIAQRIGIDDAVSEVFTIDRNNTVIKGINLTVTVTDVTDAEIKPEEIKLYQNYPNPFNPSTTIEFYIPGDENIQLKITNMLGEEVAVLHNGFLRAGYYSVNFNAESLSSGVYLISLTNESSVQVRKILLLK